MGDGRLPGPYSGFQHWNSRVRWLLENIAEAVGVDMGPGGGGGVSQADPVLSTVTTAGTVAAGAASVTLVGTGAGNILIDGEVVPGKVTITFSVNHPDTLDAISYDPQGGAILIAEVRF